MGPQQVWEARSGRRLDPRRGLYVTSKLWYVVDALHPLVWTLS